MAPETKKDSKPVQDLVVEEDLFEDFPVDAAWGAGKDDEDNRPLWVEDWDDQEVKGPDFQHKLRAQLGKGGSAMQS